MKKRNVQKLALGSYVLFTKVRNYDKTGKYHGCPYPVYLPVCACGLLLRFRATCFSICVARV